MAKRRKGGRVRKKAETKNVTLYNGDHGPSTLAAINGTEVVAIPDSPNNMGRRQRKNIIKGMNLTMRQEQAANEIVNAYCEVGKLSSGRPLKEWVQSSPNPDAAVAARVDAMSRLVKATKAIRSSEMPIVDHVCLYNEPLRTIDRPRKYTIFRDAMDRVADELRY